jgi:diguanylate cyclase (GGDEF)-like protein
VTAEIPVVAYDGGAGSGSVPAGAAGPDRAAVRDRYSPNVLAPTVPVQRDGTSPSPAQRRLLRSAARRLAEAADRAEVARAATEEAAALTDAEWSALILRSVEGPRVLWAHPEGATPTEIWGLSTLTALLAQPRPVRELLPGDPLAGGRTTSLLSVPVPSGGAMVGCLLVRRREAVSFDAAQEDGLTRLGRMTGKALLTLSQRGALEPTVAGDAVTGLPEADKLRQDLQAALRTASTYGMTATLVTLDVEGLEELRSQLGPRPADETLAVVSAALTRTLRVGDIPYRIGPARFGALLPATPAEQAARVGERVASAASAALAAAAVHPATRDLHLRSRTVAVETSPDAVMAAVDPRLRAGRVAGR